MVLLFGIPAMIGMVVLAQPIIMTMFMRGKFGFEDVLATSYPLYVMCLGLNSYMLISVLANGFYANQNTKTPVKVGIIAAISNIFFGLAFAPFWGYIGLALASACSALVNISLLYFHLSKSGYYQVSRQTMIFVLKLLIAACVMGSLVGYFTPEIKLWSLMTIWQKIYWLVWLMILAAGSYFAAIIALGIRKKEFKAAE